MNIQSKRTLQTVRTSESPADVLRAAREFFSHRNAIYAAFVEQEGSNHLTFRGQGGEELVVAAFAQDGATSVTGSSYLFDQQVTQFLASLPPAPDPALSAGAPS